MKILEALKTAALFLIAAGLFVMSYVLYDVMGKHGRYAPISFEEDQVIVMDTHTGHVWSRSFELKETIVPQTLNPIIDKGQPFSKRLTISLDK